MEGYAKYRTSGNTVIVNELMAATREAYTALWRFCFDTDLVTCAEAERRRWTTRCRGCWPTRGGCNGGLGMGYGCAWWT